MSTTLVCPLIVNMVDQMLPHNRSLNERLEWMLVGKSGLVESLRLILHSPLQNLITDDRFPDFERQDKIVRKEEPHVVECISKH